jgi:hypothetical protein
MYAYLDSCQLLARFVTYFAGQRTPMKAKAMPLQVPPMTRGE